MITTPEETIKLTEEQQKQIEVVQTRLANLENEVVIANKALVAIKAESVSATKERMYQEELLTQTKQAIEDSKKDLEDVTKLLADAKMELISVTTEIDSTKTQYESRVQDIQERELAISTAEKEQSIALETITTTEKRLKEKET